MWYVATSASVTNGSTVVTINNGDDISNIQEKSALVFEDGSPVAVLVAFNSQELGLTPLKLIHLSLSSPQMQTLQQQQQS